MKKDNIHKKIRLRFPPSPTGPLHMGNARTILFNYLFARQQGGQIVLRIEDTDKERSKQEWVENIIDELHWLGITWDEGPDIGGDFGPYKQSQRTDIYKTYLEQLLAEKKAYFCNCAADVLDAKRQDQISRGVAPKYDNTCRDKGNTQGAIRFKVAEKKVKFTDLIRGDVEFDASLIGDIVIAKNLKEVLYNFAVVVDDHAMKISHVIRGEDHIANTPKQLLLQDALGFERLEYAHLPLLLNSDKSKMSKRAGDVAVSDYHKAGYLPEALINFMVLLGWNPGTEREIFSLEELVKEFSLEKVQKGGAVFNTQRLDFLNGLYIRQKSVESLAKLCIPFLPESTQSLSSKTIEKIVASYQGRMKKLSDIADFADFFFKEKLDYDPKILTWKEMQPNDIKEALLLCDTSLRSVQASWNAQELEKVLTQAAEQFNQQKGYPLQNKGYLLWPLRVALSGKEASAGPFEIADILGKEKTLQRIQEGIERL